MRGHVKPAMQKKSRLFLRLGGRKSRRFLRLHPFLNPGLRTPRPPPPQFAIRDSPHTYTVFCTPGEQNLKVGEGGIKNFGGSIRWHLRQHPPSMEPKGHVYKTPYFVHERLVMYRFFLLQSRILLAECP